MNSPVEFFDDLYESVDETVKEQCLHTVSTTHITRILRDSLLLVIIMIISLVHRYVQKCPCEVV